MTAGKIFGGLYEGDFLKEFPSVMGDALKTTAHDVYQEGLGHIIYNGLSGTIKALKEDPTTGMKEAGQGIRALGSGISTLGTGLVLIGQPEGVALQGVGGALKYGGRSVIQAKKLHDDFAEEGFNNKSIKNHYRDIKKIEKNVGRAVYSGASAKKANDKLPDDIKFI